MNQQTNNEAFEKWITEHIVSSRVMEFTLFKREDGTYANEFTRSKYQAWQAAKQQPLKRLSDDAVHNLADHSFELVEDFDAVFKFANAIMDEMERINRE